jgi:hypothetical protein
MYINGVRAGSSPNMVGVTSPTPTSFSGDAGDEGLPHAEFSFSFGGPGNPVLVAGTNVIAVEVHNDNLTSSDIGFDLSLETLPARRTGLLFNDSDPEGDPLTAVKATDPTHGQITQFNGNGTFTYVPDLGYVGADSFTYYVRDPASNQSLPATVTITMTAATGGSPSAAPSAVFAGTARNRAIDAVMADDDADSTMLQARRRTTLSSAVRPQSADLADLSATLSASRESVRVQRARG